MVTPSIKYYSIRALFPFKPAEYQPDTFISNIMKASLFCLAVCLSLTSIAAQANVDRLVTLIQNVASQLDACQAQLATTTPFPISTTDDSQESTTGGMDTTDGMSGGMSGGQSGGNSPEARDLAQSRFRERRAGAGVVRKLRKHLKFLRDELDDCMEALDN